MLPVTRGGYLTRPFFYLRQKTLSLIADVTTRAMKHVKLASENDIHDWRMREMDQRTWKSYGLKPDESG